MRISPKLKERGQELAKKLNKKSLNVLIEDLIFKTSMNPSLLFVCCPTCKEPMFDASDISIGEGVSEVECGKGHVNNFNFETEKFE